MENQPPKRIPALDGGGICGALSLGYLERLEHLIREKEGKPDLLLCDYFDLIGGTSTGAIIAAGLSIGKTAGEMKDIFLSIGDAIFGKKEFNPLKWIKGKYSFERFEKALRDIFGDTTLGSENIKTGLCVVVKRADTLSTWPILNNKDSKYFKYNKNMLLRQVVRASAVTPGYFTAQQIDLGEHQKGTFIDGGMSLANNPALQLFLIATLKGYPYRWELGENKLSLTSIGTGNYAKRFDAENQWLSDWAMEIPNMFMEDANFLNQTLLQYLSNSPTARNIDSEIGDLKDDLINEKTALHYIRYNVLLEQNELEDLGLNFTEEQLEFIRRPDVARNKEILYEIGSKAAVKYVLKDHLK